MINPVPVREKSMLRNRLNIDKALGSDADEWMAPAGLDSQNPMQSVVFDVTYNTHENLLICVPTKTNVAMLAVISHLRELGRIGAAFHDRDHHYKGEEVSTR